MVWPSATPHTTPGSPPWATTIERATTIDRPDRPDHLDLGLWLWTLAGWTALRGFPWGVCTPQDQKNMGLGQDQPLCRRCWKGCFMTQPHRKEQSPAGPAPSFPFVWSLLLLPTGRGSEVRASPPCSRPTGPVVRHLPHSHFPYGETGLPRASPGTGPTSSL